MEQKTDRPTKKVYKEPSLKVYGNIETVTLTVNMTAALTDNINSNGNNKTT